MSEGSSAATARAHAAVKAAVLETAVDGATKQDLVAAIMLVALELAETAMDDRTLARLLLTHAERYHSRAAGAGQGETAPVYLTGEVHRAFSAAANILLTKGVEPAAVRRLMLHYAGCWLSTAEGPKTAAGELYKAADALVTRPQGVTH